MRETDGDVFVAMTGDRNYVDPLMVVMTSVVKNASDPSRIHFLLLMKDLDQTDERYLARIREVGPCKLDVIHAEEYEYLFSRIDVSKFKNEYINIVCYYRLLLFKILPPEVRRCFYVDGDMIVATDLVELFDGMDDGSLFNAVVELYAMGDREEVLSHVYGWEEFSDFVKDPYSKPYFNAGFFLLNVDMARELNLWEESQAFLDRHPDPPYADQDTLNAVIGQKHADKVRILEPAYNVFCALNNELEGAYPRSYYPQEVITKSLLFPKVYHYAGENKPWNTGLCHYNMVWWEYAAESPAAGSLLLKMQRDKEIQESEKLVANRSVYVPFENKTEFMHGIRQRIKQRYYDVDPLVAIQFDEYCFKNKTNFITRSLALRRIAKGLQNKKTAHDVDFDAVKRAIDNAEIVSFDIFDTLICRPLVEPTDVFLYLEKSMGLVGFNNERISAERRCRSFYGKEEEITYDQIYAEISPRYRELKEKELEAELQLSFRNEAVGELYDYALSKGKTVVLCSDMYLPQDFVERLLSKNGYDGYSRLYLSSTIMKSKSSGSMFKVLLSDYNVKAGSVVHIGDNYASDYLVPKDMGINSIRISKNIDALTETDYRIRLMRERFRSLPVSFMLGVLASFRHRKGEYWGDFGLRYGGPLLCAFSTWLSSAIRGNGEECIYLVARDGYSIIKALEILSVGLPMVYVYAPRHVANICNSNYLEKLKIDAKEGASTIKGLVDAYNERYGKSESFEEVSDMIAFIQTHKEEFDRLQEERLSNYRGYVAKLSDDRKIAFVDSVTVNFSSQSLLQKALPDREITGYYWLSIENNVNHNVFSTTAHHSFQREHRDIIDDWNVMEFFFTSPEPSILDVDEDGKPIYRGMTKYDQTRTDVYPLMSEGMLAFVRRWKELVPQEGCTQIGSSEAVGYVNILCQTPTKVDKEHMSAILHAYDSEHSKFVPIFKHWWD